MSEIMNSEKDRITKAEVLNHELEEWRYLNTYVNDMDKSYMQIISLCLAIATGVFTIVFASMEGNGETDPQKILNIQQIVLLIPPVIVAVFGYMSYQFRITAILRGHLAQLEKSMNKKLGEDVHLWNSALVEVFMVNNNPINSRLMISSCFAVAVMTVFCVKHTKELFVINQWEMSIFYAYWVIIAVLALIVLCPFFKNNLIRCMTEDKKRVLKKYKLYQEYGRDKDKIETKWETIDKKIDKKNAKKKDKSKK